MGRTLKDLRSLGQRAWESLDGRRMNGRRGWPFRRGRRGRVPPQLREAAAAQGLILISARTGHGLVDRETGNPAFGIVGGVPIAAVADIEAFLAGGRAKLTTVGRQA
jgi:hypothetical protein